MRTVIARDAPFAGIVVEIARGGPLVERHDRIGRQRSEAHRGDIEERGRVGLRTLLAADIEWFSYYDVRGEGKMRQARIYRGVMYDTSSIERVLLNIVVRDKNVEKTINAIQEAARTGEIGDGRSFVIPVEDTIRIRTGERGDIALYNAEQEK